MTPSEVLALLTLLDHLLQLGGRLVTAAKERRPELDLTPLPTLDEMDAARKDAAARIDGSSLPVPIDDAVEGAPRR